MFKNQKIKINWWNRLELFVFSRELQNAKNTIGVWYYVFNISNDERSMGRWVVGSDVGAFNETLQKYFLNARTHIWFLYELKYNVGLSKSVCGIFHFFIFSIFYF